VNCQNKWSGASGYIRVGHINVILAKIMFINMNKLPHTIEAMESLFVNAKRRSILFLLVGVLWFACCAYIYASTSNEHLKSSLTVFFGIAICVWGIGAVSQLFVINKTSIPLDEISDERIGNFTIDEVRAMFKEVLDNTVLKENPTVYINSLSVYNAFAMNTLFNFNRPTNAIYMTRKCFDVLNREEILAILYHEMAHFNKYMYMESKTLNLGTLFFLFLPFSFTVLIPGVILKVIFVILMIFLVAYVWNKIRAFHEFEGHALEYLCDTKAAQRVGPLAMINALIVLSRENVKLDLETKKDRLKKKVINTKPRILVDWTHFDNHIVNGKIEQEEYDQLILTLKKTQNPMLIADSEIDEDGSSHPSLTNRVLFLHRNFASQRV
jgi:Zn-dependent protease with chaperone function